ncbi:hypothetical protein KT99_04464 [Shewanella benthica KT99]|uniref:Uncharacterized protein n=1 Tax=Shewanella benthica KT99 TaxID=314608 RepID=A9D2L1_9GAMM|nr:hypothetical protein KT99_04464 [Shewanella benthica KT99]
MYGAGGGLLCGGRSLYWFDSDVISGNARDGRPWTRVGCAFFSAYILFFAFVGYKTGQSNKTSETSTDEILVADT